MMIKMVQLLKEAFKKYKTIKDLEKEIELLNDKLDNPEELDDSSIENIQAEIVELQLQLDSIQNNKDITSTIQPDEVQVQLDFPLDKNKKYLYAPVIKLTPHGDVARRSVRVIYIGRLFDEPYNIQNHQDLRDRGKGEEKLINQVIQFASGLTARELSSKTYLFINKDYYGNSTPVFGIDAKKVNSSIEAGDFHESSSINTPEEIGKIVKLRGTPKSIKIMPDELLNFTFGNNNIVRVTKSALENFIDSKTKKYQARGSDDVSTKAGERRLDTANFKARSISSSPEKLLTWFNKNSKN